MSKVRKCVCVRARLFEREQVQWFQMASAFTAIYA